MSKSGSHPQLLEELERAESVLGDLLATLVSLNAVLKPIEQDMKVTDFASNGEYVQGVSRGIVCVPSGLIQGDPLQQIIAEREKGRKFPALIKAGNRSESPVIVESIVNMLHAEDEKKLLEFVINLRWAEFPAVLEKENTIIIGNRYMSGSPTEMANLQKRLEDLNFLVLRDNGEFGGGPLIYEIIKSFEDRLNLLVVELTLSRSSANKRESVVDILEMLATL
ncbi:MAG: hypothetical protein EAX87_13105 [Candidatus Thorarchaeota archaeon]|nr:hypothetical protein [Candidatus Thorarchaeota archaeon]